MSQGLNILIEMGFPSNRSEKALAITGNQGVEAAMEWLLAHGDDPDIDEPLQTQGHVLGEESDQKEIEKEAGNGESATNGSQTPAGDVAMAKSIKCDECGKQLKDEAAIQLHAARSGHQSFSESIDDLVPLTEEEKKEQLRKLEEKIKLRRLEREETDRKEAVAREQVRRRTGQEMTLIKQKMQDDEIKKIAEDRRREKLEEKLARQRVREQIERDKKARAEKFGTQNNVTSELPKPEPKEIDNTSTQIKKDYKDCRLQIRLPSGENLTQTFGANESLAAVRLYVQMNKTDNVDTFSLMTLFPKKLFNEEDMEKPLSILGLVPSAVLIVTQAH